MSNYLREVLGAEKTFLNPNQPRGLVADIGPDIPGGEGANEGFWREQIRDRLGQFAKMFGNVLFDIEIEGLGRITGHGEIVEMVRPQVALVSVKNHKVLPDGDYEIPGEDLEGIDGLIPDADYERVTGKKLPKRSAPELKDEVTGDEAMQVIRNAGAEYAKSQGRFPMARTYNDIKQGLRSQYSQLLEGIKQDTPELLKNQFILNEDGTGRTGDIETEDDFWGAVNAMKVDTGNRWVAPENINPLAKEINRRYAEKFLGIKKDGLITFYRNVTQEKENPAEAAAGYISLDKKMAWDYNSQKGYSTDVNKGRYIVKAKPDEVLGILGLSGAVDEFSVVISPEVTSLPGRFEKVGGLEKQKVDTAPWLDSERLDSMSRLGGGSPFRFLAPMANFDYYPLDSNPFGEKNGWASFYEANGLKQGDLPNKYNELYGEGAWEKDFGDGSPRATSFTELFIEFTDEQGNKKCGLNALDLRKLSNQDMLNNAESGDDFDRNIKVLSTMQELMGEPFFVNKGHSKNDPRLDEVKDEEPVVEKTPEPEKIEEPKKEPPVTHTFNGKTFEFSSEEMENAYYYISRNYLGAKDVTDEEGIEFNERMRALTDYLRPGSVSDETIPAQEQLLGTKIKIGELRHSAPPSRFDEIMENGIRPRITDKVGTEKYSRRRFGVFLANDYTSSEAGNLGEVFRVKVPENNLRVDSGYTPYGQNMYIERTLEPEEIEHLGHIPANSNDSDIEVNNFGLHNGRGTECTICNPELKSLELEKESGPDAPLTPQNFTKEQEKVVKDYSSYGYRDVNTYLRLGRQAAIDEFDTTNSEKRADEAEKAIEEINKVFETSTLEKDAILFRLVPRDIAEGVNVGDILSDPAILSTTKNPESDDINRQFNSNIFNGLERYYEDRYDGAHPNDVGWAVIEIEAPTGTKAIDITSISEFPAEREVLLPPGASLEVISIEETEVKNRYKRPGDIFKAYKVKVRAVPPNDAPELMKDWDAQTGLKTTTAKPIKSIKPGFKNWNNEIERIFENGDNDLVGDMDNSSGDVGNTLQANFIQKAGFNEKPKILSQEEFDAIEQETIYRGHQSTSFIDNYIDSELQFSGEGYFGNGTYTSNKRDTAETYAGNSGPDSSTQAKIDERILEMKMLPDANVLSFEEVTDLREWANQKTREFLDGYEKSGANPAQYQEAEWRLFNEADYTNIAIMLGIDAIRFKVPLTDAEEYYTIILNRGKVAINGKS